MSMNISDSNNAPSLPQFAPGMAPTEKKEEAVKVPTDNFTFADGVNHPLEAALLPTTDQVLGQDRGALFLAQGGALVKGTVTRTDDPAYKEYINVEITQQTSVNEQTQQISGETFVRAAYGKGQEATFISERGTLVTFQEGETALPGMTVSGYVNKSGVPQEVNEELANIIGPGGAVTQGKVTKEIELIQQSAAFLPGVEPDNIPEEIDPTTLGSYQTGTIAGVKFERVVIPDGFPNYKIVGQFGDLEESGTIAFSDEKAVVDRTVGPFKIHEEVTQLKK